VNTRQKLPLVLALFVAIALGCESDPAAPEPATPIVTPDDVPVVPEPTSLGADTPQRSESLYVTQPNRADFVGRAVAGIGTWALRQFEYKCVVAGQDWSRVDPLDDPSWTLKRNVHSDDLSFMGQDVTPHIQPWIAIWARRGRAIDPRYVANGDGSHDMYLSDHRSMLEWTSWWKGGYQPCTLVRVGDIKYLNELQLRGCPRISNPTYITRERFWAAVPVDGQGAMSVQVPEGATYSIETTYTRGMSFSESRQFAQTVSENLSLGFDEYISAGTEVEYAVTESFGTETEITKEESVAVTQSVEGRPGKIVVLTLWELVERYSITDADGGDYIDPKIRFEQEYGVAEVHGIALAMRATEFDAAKMPSAGSMPLRSEIIWLVPLRSAAVVASR
jgi:hypothetical protein